MKPGNREIHKLIPEGQLANLTKTSDVNGATISFLLMLSFLFLLFLLFFFYDFALVKGGIFVLIAVLQHHLFIAQHESLHFLLFRTRRFNDIFGGFFGLMVGFPLSYRRHHLRHHAFLGTQEDPDFSNYEKPLKGKQATFMRLVLLLSGFATVEQAISYYLKGQIRSSSASDLDKSKPTRSNPIDLILLLVTQCSILLVFVFFSDWKDYFLFWIAPLFTITKSLNSLRNYIEHEYQLDEVNIEVNRLVSVQSNRIERFFFAPLNFNFHAEHHLFTNVPYYNLPKLSEILSCHNNLPYRIEKSYLGSLKRCWQSQLGDSK